MPSHQRVSTDEPELYCWLLPRLVESVSHSPDFLSKIWFICNLFVLSRACFLIFCSIQVGCEFSRLSLLVSFCLLQFVPQVISFLSHCLISSKEKPDHTFQETSTCSLSKFISYTFYLLPNGRTQFTSVFCHLITRLAFYPVAKHMFLLFMGDLTRNTLTFVFHSVLL